MSPAFSIAIATVLIAAYAVVIRIRLACLRKKHILLHHSGAETETFLDTFVGNITKMGDSDEWMNETVRYACDFMEAQAACVFRLEGKELTAVGVHGPFPSLSGKLFSDCTISGPKYGFETMRREKLPLGTGLIGTVAADRKMRAIPDLSLDEEFPDLARSTGSVRAVIALPLLSGNRVTGVLCLINNRNNVKGAFTAHQAEQARSLGRRISLVMDIMNIYATLREQERISQELVFTRKLQLALMPEDPRMDWGKFHIHALAVSSKEVSGDYFDFVKVDQDRLLVVVGDASGKGLPACLIMAMTRTFISSSAARFNTLKDLLSGLNEYLRLNTIGEKYITMGCCLLNRKDSTLEYACAGHTPLIMHLHQHLREIRPDGPVCGIFPDAEYESLNTQIQSDTSLLLFSDGINEALNSAGEEFGMERLREAYNAACSAGKDAAGIVREIKTAVDEYSGYPESLADDQTLVAIRYEEECEQKENP